MLFRKAALATWTAVGLTAGVRTGEATSSGARHVVRVATWHAISVVTWAAGGGAMDAINDAMDDIAGDTDAVS